MSAYCSAPRRAMMRPSSMYIEAANSAGARSKKRDCTMYGVSSNRGA